MDKISVYVGADHAGFSLKATLLPALQKEFPSLKFTDLGCPSEASVDYPDFAKLVAEKVAAGARGILICGSGLGMCISANKVAGVRATSAWDITSARLSRMHNDSNVVCLGARLTGFQVALDAVKVWLTTEFEGGRHQGRLDKVTQLEKA